jgi:hypothetical protein
MSELYKNIFNELEAIKVCEHDINKKIESLDLHDKIKEIEGFMIDISKNPNFTDKESIKNSVDSLQEAVNGLHKVLKQISTKLTEYMYAGVIYSFYSYIFGYSIEFSKEIKDLENKEKLVMSRYNRTKELIRVF